MLGAMSDSGSRRLALYNGLNDLIGPELTNSLMSFLPTSPATELVTKTDIGELKEVVRYLSQRLDRLQHTLLGGFAAMIAALLATGFLG